LTWSQPSTLITDGPNFLDDKESITADPHNANFVYAVWDRVKIGNTFNFGGQALFARSTDGGQTWKPASVIFQSPGGDNNIGHQIVVLPDGTLIDAFAERPADTLDILRSKDGGKDWSRPIVVAQEGVPDIRDPDVFSTFVRGGVPLPEVAADPNSGQLYAVWPDSSFIAPLPGSAFPFDVSGIAFSMSSDGGFTWSAAIIVNQTPTNLPNPLNSQAFNPDIAVGLNGTVAVSYYDFRFNDANPGVPTDHWAAFGNPSGPGGLTNLANWGNELRLTGASFNMEDAPLAGRELFLGDYQGLAAAGTGFEALFSQAGSTSSTASVFSRQILDPPAALSAASQSAQGTSADRNGFDAFLAEVGSRPNTVSIFSREVWLPTMSLRGGSLLSQGAASTALPASLAWTSKGGDFHEPAIWEWPGAPAALSGSLGDSVGSRSGSGEPGPIGEVPWSDPFAAWDLSSQALLAELRKEQLVKEEGRSGWGQEL
jgi:hypothetical protein